MRAGGNAGNAGREPARDRIVEAAIACIERDGLHSLTIRGIAREAGVNSAAISYYFRSKEKLIDAVLKTTLANAFEDWEIILDRREEALETRLRSVLSLAVEGALRYPGMVKAHLYETFINGSSRTPFIKSFTGFLSLIAREMRACFPRKSSREIGAETVQILSAVLLPAFMPQLFRSTVGFDVSDRGAREEYVDGLVKRFFSNG